MIDDSDCGTPATGIGRAEACSLQCPACRFWSLWPVAAAELPQCAGCGRPLPWVVPGTAAGFDAAIDTPALVLVEFWAPWSGSSLALAPQLHRLAARHAGRLKLIKIEIDREPGLGILHRVTGVPLLMIMTDGEEVDRRHGSPSEGQLTRWIDRWVTHRGRTAATAE
ncbi:thioredoxin family protein [Microlunatus parietis]|uniref:Thioredoxin 2 n=1 Tax=Microlunatus parietis TaxID=682979 RepID=A0A7Y9LCL2_9ACTN|nr:thioredoxin family protein [Microlunatus parietis]NYE74969.1 thioredoxin 2 [Microlunatus parietis]